MATSFQTGTPVPGSVTVNVVLQAPSTPPPVPVTAIPQATSFVPLKVPVLNGGYTS